jgi:calmodulin-regulated spectrin-associated protein
VVFEQYQKRKAEANNDDLSTPHHAPVTMRDTSKARRGRPLSVHASSVVSHQLTSPVSETNVMKRSPSQGAITGLSHGFSILSLHNTRIAAASARHNGPATERRAMSPPAAMRYRAATVDSNLSDAGSSNSGQDIYATPSSVYNGPKLFKKPTTKSNRQIIHNAIRDSCLKGKVDEPLRDKALDALGRTDGCHFLVLFREGQFKGLYTFDPEAGEGSKFFGTGPPRINDSMTEKLFQYNSGTKTFKVVTTTHHMSVQIDGIALQSGVWTGKKTTGPKPPLEMF